jgi:uncharacterized membrane protein
MLKKEELKKISNLIHDIEQKTTGEIKVTLLKRKHFFQRKKSVFDLAVREFHRLKMDQKDHHKGVLIYILEKNREFQILGDEGVHKKISQDEWDKMAKKMSEHFKNEKYFDGICEGIRDVGDKLSKAFPRNG